MSSCTTMSEKEYFDYLESRISKGFELYDKDAKKVGKFLKNTPLEECVNFSATYPQISKYFGRYTKGGVRKKLLKNIKVNSMSIIPSR